MPGSVGPVAGTKLFIGTAGVAPGALSPDMWVEIGDISNLGDISQQFSKIMVESVGSGDSYELKGVRSNPSLELTLNRNDSDLGQIALKAAAAATRGTLYPFKILESDGAATTPGVIYWQGEVFGYGPSYGGVNALKTVKTSVSIRPSTLDITLST